MSICISAAKSRRSKHAWMFHKEATPTFASKNEFKQTAPWNHQKAYGFLIISGGIEVN